MFRNQLFRAFSVRVLVMLQAAAAVILPVRTVFGDELQEIELFDESFAEDTDEWAVLSEEVIESDSVSSDQETEIADETQAADPTRKKASKGTVFDADGLIEDPSGNKIDENLVFEITDEAVREEIAREEAEVLSGPVYGRLYPPAPLLDGINSFRQGDMRWGTHPYGYANAAATIPATISSSGCGLLSLVNAVYYMTGNFIEPVKLADWAWAHGFRMNGAGTVHSLYQAYAHAYGSAYGFRFAGTASSLISIRQFLAGNGTAIISTDHHLMCVADYDSRKNRYLLLDSAPSPFRGTYPTGYRYLSDADFAGSIPVYAILLLEAVPGEGKELPLYAMKDPFEEERPDILSAFADHPSLYSYITKCYLREMPALVCQDLLFPDLISG